MMKLVRHWDHPTMRHALLLVKKSVAAVEALNHHTVQSADEPAVATLELAELS